MAGSAVDRSLRFTHSGDPDAGRSFTRYRNVAFALLAALVFKPAAAQTSASGREEPAQVVITGTRVQNRSALETAVPIDVLSSDLFRNRGVPEISQALSEALPSYNYRPAWIVGPRLRIQFGRQRARVVS